MSLQKHITIATVALARGLIDSHTFVDVMRHLDGGAVEGARDDELERVWVASGRLTADQLATVLRGVDALDKGATEVLPFTAFARGTVAGTDAGDDFDPETVGTAATIAGFGSHAPTGTPAESDIVTIPRRDESGTAEVRGGEATKVESPSARQGTIPGVPAPSPAPARGQATTGPPRATVRARYERREVLGAGGLGTVTACFDTLLARRVAVKVARADAAGAEDILEREARIVAGLEHPNIIPVYDAGANPGAGAFYVMRLMTQPTLDQVLERLDADEDGAVAKKYGLKRLLRYFVQICQAVDYAHNQGVFHCDLKPANILLGNFGEVLVVDWGLAQSRDYPGGPRGGTPGYMAPEQLDEDFEASPTTDVFALGAILYVMLALKPAFPERRGDDRPTTAGTEPRRRYDELWPPSAVAPGRDIPSEVEEICLRAISRDPADRFATAAELARAIEDYLEGTKERERRRAEADSSVEAGDEMAERYFELDEQRPEQIETLTALREEIEPWAPVEDKRALWDAEDMLSVTDALRVRTLQAAVGGYEQALDAVAGHEGAQRGLARLYWRELERAQDERDELNQIYFEQLVRQHDDGTFLEAVGGDGRLVVTASPGVTLSLAPLHEDDRRLVRGEARALTGPTPEPLALAPGSYLVEATRPDDAAAAPVRYPVFVRAGSEVRVVVDLAPAVGLGPGEILVPGGRALLGDTLPVLDCREPGPVDVPTFVIAREPVTFRDYLAFLDDVGDDGTSAELMPSGVHGEPMWRRDGGAWRPVATLGVDRDVLLRCPAFGVSARAAQAYAAWHASRTGRAYRLPRDAEWEKAARGTDGRFFPWGDHFDATLCKMRDSRPGIAVPEPCGVFEADESPYGVRDMAGTIAEWTVPDAWREGDDLDRVYSRGGAWCDWSSSCRVTARRRYWATERTRRVGFRLSRDV